MFEFLWKHLSQEPDKTTALEVTQPTGNTIVFLYDDVDRELWYELAVHINTLILRTTPCFEWKYYCYSTPMTRSENKHEAFVSDLQKAFLFVPCTSATFLSHFWTVCSKDERLRPLLSEMYVQPIPFRAAHGVTQSILQEPLAAYPAGAVRDAACVQVIATLEQKLLSYHSRQGETLSPVAQLAETTSKLVTV